MLTPKTGYGAGILHRNSMALAARGPWIFDGVTWGDAVDGPADGEPTRPEHRVIGGTCEVCSASIVNIVRMHNTKGERVMVGIDCADTLMTNNSKLRLAAAVKPHEKAKRAAAKTRRIERTIAKNLETYSAQLALLDSLGDSANNFARCFGLSVARSLRSGKITALTAPQSACLDRLVIEQAAR
jgi:hypothetical protein